MSTPSDRIGPQPPVDSSGTGDGAPTPGTGGPGAPVPPADPPGAAEAVAPVTDEAAGAEAPPAALPTAPEPPVARREPDPAPIDPAAFEATIAALVRAGSPGAVLRQARLMRRLSITNVAGTTRIRSEYVAAMEDGAQGVLPPGRYGLNLYRSYAIFLGVSPDDIVRMYDLESGRRARSIGIFGARVSVQSSRRLLAAAVISVAFAIAAALWYFLQPLGAAEIESATSRVLAQATFLPGIAAGATRVPVPTAAFAPRPPTAVPTPLPVPTSAPGAAAPTPVPTGEPAPADDPVDPDAVHVTVVEDSWIRVTVDGNPTFEGILGARQKRTYNGSVVAIVIGNAGGVDLVAYGDRIGIVGKPNEVFEGVYRRPSR